MDQSDSIGTIISPPPVGLGASLHLGGPRNYCGGRNTAQAA
jgi:hypothetical protein